MGSRVREEVETSGDEGGVRGSEGGEECVVLVAGAGLEGQEVIPDQERGFGRVDAGKFERAREEGLAHREEAGWGDRPGEAGMASDAHWGVRGRVGAAAGLGRLTKNRRPEVAAGFFEPAGAGVGHSGTVAPALALAFGAAVHSGAALLQLGSEVTDLLADVGPELLGVFEELVAVRLELLLELGLVLVRGAPDLGDEALLLFGELLGGRLVLLDELLQVLGRVTLRGMPSLGSSTCGGRPLPRPSRPGRVGGSPAKTEEKDATARGGGEGEGQLAERVHVVLRCSLRSGGRPDRTFGADPPSAILGCRPCASIGDRVFGL
jgi:hypothetical protein